MVGAFLSAPCVNYSAYDFTETLRRSAETTMHTLVRAVFTKLKLLDPAEEEAKLAIEAEDETKEAELRMTVTTEVEKPPIETEEVHSEAPEAPEIVDIPEEIQPPRMPVSAPNRQACELQINIHILSD